MKSNALVEITWVLLMLVLTFYLGWASGHSYGLLDQEGRCPREVVVKPGTYESCDSCCPEPEPASEGEACNECEVGVLENNMVGCVKAK